MPQKEKPKPPMITGSFYGLPANGHINANYSKIGNFVKKMTELACLIRKVLDDLFSDQRPIFCSLDHMPKAGNGEHCRMFRQGFDTIL